MVLCLQGKYLHWFVCFGAAAPQWAMLSSFMKFLDHTQRRNTFRRTPLDEWSARRRDLYLTTYNIHNSRYPCPPVGFEPTVSAGEWPQAYALDRAAIGTGSVDLNTVKFVCNTKSKSISHVSFICGHQFQRLSTIRPLELTSVLCLTWEIIFTLRLFYPLKKNVLFIHWIGEMVESKVGLTLWIQHKTFASTGNRAMIPVLPTLYPSHCTERTNPVHHQHTRHVRINIFKYILCILNTKRYEKKEIVFCSIHYETCDVLKSGTH